MMTALAFGLSALAAALLALPALLLSLQIGAALWPPRRRARSAAAAPTPALPRPTLAVLVPAHNEASGIAATLASIQRQLRPGDLLLVVADNCSDHTADIAAAAGAVVTRRQAPQQQGKAAALAHGLRHLASLPLQPAVLILIDADCWLGDGALDHLASRCGCTGRPVQALYLMHASRTAPARRRAAAFAWRLKNGLRAQGRARLGMACQLSGSGMAFPAQLLTPELVAQGGLVEDLELGLQLAAQGCAPLFCPQAIVHSRFPDNARASHSQRTRWEHGHLHLLLRSGPRHLGRSWRQRDWRYASLALDLCIPPLSLLLMLSLVADSALFLLGWRLHLAWACWLALLPGVLLLAALAAAWRACGRDLLTARQLVRLAPRYLLAKIPLYLRFLYHRQRDWVASERDRR